MGCQATHTVYHSGSLHSNLPHQPHMTVLDSECNVCFEEKSKDDHRKGKMFSPWEKAAAKDDTEPHVDRGHPEQNPPQFLLCSPIWDAQPRGLHLICLPRDTQYTPTRSLHKR